MTLRLNGDSSGFTEIKAADSAGDNSIKLPASNGSANQLLQNGGTAGELQYTSNVSVDSSGRLLVGTSASMGDGSPLQVVNDTANPIEVFRGQNSTSGPILLLGKSRGTSASPSPVIDTDQTGAIAFKGYDGSIYRDAAQVRSFVEGTPGTNVMPGKLVFSTNSGGASPTPRVEIGSNGALKLLAGCPGIDFSAIQTNAAEMTSETLDSYEEGTFDAGFSANAPTNVNYTRQAGYYVKVGKLVQCVGTFAFTTYTTFPTGYSSFTLPFTPESIDGEGDAFSQSWWACLAGGQVRQTVGGANCLLFGPLGQSGFSNIFTDGLASGLANADFNTIFNGYQGSKVFRYHHIYRAA